MLLIGGLGELPASQVEVEMPGGERFLGELLSVSDDRIVLRRTFTMTSGSITAEIGYARNRIVSIVDLDEEYQRRLEGIDPAALDAVIGLAHWCRETAMPERAAHLAMQVLKSDRINGGALVVLDRCGYVQIDGAWVNENAWLQGRGLVRHRDRVMTTEDRRRICRAEYAQRQAQQALARIATALAPIERSLHETTARLGEIAVEQKRLETIIAESDPTQARKRLDATKARLEAAQSTARNNPRSWAKLRQLQIDHANEEARFELAPAQRQGGLRDLERLTREQSDLVRKREADGQRQQALATARDRAQAALTEAEGVIGDIESRNTPAAVATRPESRPEARKAPPPAVAGTGLTVNDL